MVKAGLSEVIGSWKIIEILLPRSSRSCAAGRPTRSVPSNRIAPPAIRPGGRGTRPMMLCAVTLLPQPLSPTTPRVRPAKSVKLTPSTARNSPSSVAKCVRSSLTSRSGTAPPRFGASSCPVDRRVQLMVSVIAGFVSLRRQHHQRGLNARALGFFTEHIGILGMDVLRKPLGGQLAAHAGLLRLAIDHGTGCGELQP